MWTRCAELLVAGLLVLWAGAAVATPSPAAPAAADWARTTLAFADSLLVEADYYRSVTEYKRALFLLPPAAAAGRAHAVVGIGKALYLGNQYLRAAAWLEERNSLFLESPWRAEGLQFLFRARIRAGQPGAALELARAVSGPEADFYRGLALAHLERWPEARQTFDALPGDHAFAVQAALNSDLVRHAEQAGRRSPTAAGLLATIPGAGYLYCGHVRSGISALVVNSVFVFSACQAFRHDQDILGGFLSFLSLTWYSSSIYGSVQAAHRYNRQQRDLYLDQMAF